MLTSTRLSFHFDPALLRNDLDAASAHQSWEPHFNRNGYFGDWSGIALRGNSPTHRKLMIIPSDTESYRNHDVLDACAYIRDRVMPSFFCPIRSVRFLKLAPGAGIREHRDAYVGHEHDEIRIHIPVMTNPEVEFIVGGERLQMSPGECWYVNVDLLHSVHNRGATDRVHLLIDAEINEWLRDLLDAAPPSA